MPTKLKCLLLDDELPGLTYLKLLCEQIPEVEVVKAFNSPALLLAEVGQLDFDLCIMDIEMPGMNGVQVANLLNGKPVIFATAYKEYAAAAFDIDAIDYVQKPIKKERLQQAVAKAISRARVNKEEKKEEKQFLQLNTSHGKSLISFERICYIRTSETDSRDKVAQLLDGSLVTLKNITLDKLETLLPGQMFCRINKKEIVAIRFVQLFSFDEITTSITSSDGASVKLSLGEVYRFRFLQKLQG